MNSLLLKQYIRLQLQDTSLAKGQNVQISLYGAAEVFTVSSYTPSPAAKADDPTFFVSKLTSIEIRSADSPSSGKEESKTGAAPPQAKGPSVPTKYKDLLLEMLRICLDSGPALASIGKPKGIIIQGASGAGKTMLIRQAQTELKYPFIYVAGYELISKVPNCFR